MVQDSIYREIVRSFFERKIIDVNIQKPFVLANGKETPVYIDHRRIFSDPVLRKKVIIKWAETLIEEIKLKFDNSIIFAGTVTAGIVPAFALAEKFNTSFIYVRQKAKEHSLGRCIEGIWNPDNKVIVVDDMVTTGKSIINTIELLRSEGANIVFATSISRHEFCSTLEEFQKINVELISIFKTTDLFDIAYKMNLLNSKEMRLIMQWMSEQDIKII